MGFFSSIFKSSRLKESLDFTTINIDMHSHLIPGIDDGAQNMEESLSLIRKLYDLGFRKLITTPHIQADFYKNTPEIILSGLDTVRKAVNEAGIDIEIYAAAEYLIDTGFEKLLEEGNLLTFGDNYLLIEFSYFYPPANMQHLLFELQTRGYKIILAHPERYSYWHKDPSKYQDLKNRGILFQLNTISLSGYYQLPVKKAAEDLIEKGMIELIGSDAHNEHYLKGLRNSCYEKSLKALIESGKLINQSLLS